MYFVYIVRCCDGSLYTGMTADLRRRLREHMQQLPSCARYTKSHPALALEAAWQTMTRSDALRLEALIKRLPRSRKLALIAAPAEVETVFGEKLKDSKYSPLAQEMLSLSFK